MATTKKTNRKPMSPQAKRNLGNVFKSIISNQAAIDGAKEAPLFIAIIFLLLSIILPLIPILVTTSSYYGSSFVANYSYSADQGLAYTTNDLKTKGFEFKVLGGNLTFYKDGQEFDTTNQELVSYHTLKDGNEKTYYNFMFYITNLTGQDLVDYVSTISAKQFESGTIMPRTADPIDIERYERDNVTFYTPSFIILAKETMGMQLFKFNSTTAAAASYGGLDWSHTADGDLLVRTSDVSKKAETTTEIEAIFDNWRGVLNEVYENQKVKTVWTQVGIFAGVYAGLILFMGLMLFLLTRGKNNPYSKVITFFVSQKIAWWASFTPAVLGMILAFIMPGNVIGQMGFIVLVSIRIMWLSMRQLKPM